jgi:ribose transport system ATP-binding protein
LTVDRPDGYYPRRVQVSSEDRETIRSVPGSGAAADKVFLRLRNVSKIFPGQRALDGADMDLRAGEIHGLVGQNGSGKSTLIKILAGYHAPEPGAQAWLNGESFELGHADVSARAGLSFIHQDLGLIPSLSTVDNLALGRGYGSRWWISLGGAARRARDLVRDFGFDFDVTAPVAKLGAVERSLVAIIRALGDGESDAPRLLVLDEPTESLAKPEADLLFEAVRRAAERGAAVLYVSHRLDEVLALSDEITVLRDGKVVAHRSSSSLDHQSLVALIVGHSLEQLNPPSGRHEGDVLMRTIDLSGQTVRDLSFQIHRGEIVGVAGLVGSGREEIPYLIGGARPWVGGVLEVEGDAVTQFGPRAAAGAGVFLVAADRNTQSAIPALTARENVTLPRIESRGPMRWLSVRRERSGVRTWLQRTHVDPPDPERLFENFSGGNQQKIVLARALRCDPSLLILDEPVQGVDVGARVEIFQQLLEAAAAGMAILVASSEPEDLARLCDRVLVMRGGRIGAELRKDSLSPDRIVEQSLTANPEVHAE